jgi:hypothetical protein
VLCSSFDEVVRVLEHEVARKPAPAMRTLLRQARTAQRLATTETT